MNEAEEFEFRARAEAEQAQPTAAPMAPAAPQLSGMDQFLRQTALTGRAAAQGVVNTLALPNTIQNWEMNKVNALSNRLLGTKFDANYPSLAQQFSQGMTKAGAYEPASSGEQMSSAVTQGITGALTGGGLVGTAGVANAARVASAGATGAASSETARQVGLPPWMQFGVGLAGAQIPSMLESGAQTIGQLAAPLTSSGQSRMAGMVLNEQASDPASAIAALQRSKPAIPGSLPTMGSASQDLGLLGVEKGLKSSNPVPFGERLSGQNMAQQTEMSNLAGTPAQLEAAIKARSTAASPMYAAAAQDSAPIDNEMIALMQRPSMQQALVKAQSLAQEKGQTFGMSSTAPGGAMSLSGQDLQGLKMALDDMKTTAFTQGIGTHQANALQDTLDSLKDWMGRNVPSQRSADAAFQSASAPINRMQTLQDLQQSAATSAVDVQTRLPFFSSAKFSNALAKIQDEPNGVTALDMTRLQAIQRDLQNQQAVNGPLLKAPGSDTFQNFSINQNMLGAGGVGRLAMKPLDFLYQKVGVDKSVNSLLTGAALDPSKAASLMQKAATPTNQFNMYRLGNAYDVGTFFGLSGLSQ